MAGLTLEDATRAAWGGVYPNGNMEQWINNYHTSQRNNQYPNAYTRQSPIITPNDNLSGTIPTNPSTQTDFLENYRATTKQLGNLARARKTKGQAEGERPAVDAETKSIMDRIKLPTYSDALSPEQTDAFRRAYAENGDAAMQDMMSKTAEWDEDNFYYKLRAAQVLKKMPEKQREDYLNNFNVSMYDAKNTLDKVISQEDQKTYSALASAIKGIGNIGNFISDAYLRATGQRTSSTDENGVTTTTTITNGPANLDDLAERLGENNSFRLYSKSDFDENGELTEEAKARGPEAWNSETTNPDGTPKNAEEASDATAEGSNDEESSSETIEYTYEPGDNFGQVLVKLGLVSDHGLWGEDGDVEYYTKQLEKQGIWPEGERGNIPIGTTIKLRRRK